jgi:hypothetical protein
MGYQPNRFVNPNQGGVELPPGCKDLMALLKSEGSEGASLRVGVANGLGTAG